LCGTGAFQTLSGANSGAGTGDGVNEGAGAGCAGAGALAGRPATILSLRTARGARTTTRSSVTKRALIVATCLAAVSVAVPRLAESTIFTARPLRVLRERDGPPAARRMSVRDRPRASVSRLRAKRRSSPECGWPSRNVTVSSPVGGKLFDAAIAEP
jgi:hypothetical protein